MKKLYEKNEILFAVLWIVVYCAVLTPIRGEWGNESPWAVAALLLIAAAAAAFIGKNGLMDCYGLRGWPRDSRKYLYFIPLYILATGNLWGGFQIHYSGMAQVLAVISMALVGFVEEVIFRGFLFKALLKKDRPAVAVVISAVTFGVGHIVNLLAGQANLETVMQVVFAVAWGFLLTVTYYKCGSLWPCVAVHAAVDVLSTFSADSETMGWVYIGATVLMALCYCLYLRRLPTAPNHELRPENP